MSLKLKTTILHITVSFVSILFIFMIYDSYVTEQKKEIEKQLNKLMNVNGIYLQETISGLKKSLLEKKDLTQEIHFKIHKKLKQNKTLDIFQIKEEIVKEYKLKESNEDIEIFLINNDLSLNKTTEKSIFSFTLSQNSKEALQGLKNIDDYIYLKQNYANLIDQQTKSYSYTKLSNSLYLGLNFVIKDIKKHKDVLYDMLEVLNANIDFFYVMSHDNKNQFYESVVTNRVTLPFTQEYLKTKKMFPFSEQTDDYIIKTSREWTSFDEENKNILTIYIPILKKTNPVIVIPGDIIFKIELDISEQKLFFETIINKLVLFILLHFFLVFIIFYFTNKYQKLEKQLHKEIDKNTNLLEYNKQFISNLVHQIRTPLAVIMTNISLLEVMMKKNIKQYTFQINASINMLSNSYENLSYYVSLKSLEYPKRKINTSKFIQERIGFFDDIAYANKKNLLSNIEPNIFCEFNDIELERLIDNLIVTSLHFCDYDGKVVITFTKRENITSLKLKVLNINNSVDIDILNKKDIKKLEDISNFALGLYLIEYISSKNSMQYSFYEKNTHLIFECKLI